MLAVAIAIGDVHIDGVSSVNDAGRFIEAIVNAAAIGDSDIIEGIGNVNKAGVVQLQRLCHC